MRIPTREELENLECVYKGDVTKRWWELTDKYHFELEERNKGIPPWKQNKIVQWGYSSKKWFFLDLEKFEELTLEETEVLEFYRTKTGRYEVIVGPVSLERVTKIFHDVGK